MRIAVLSFVLLCVAPLRATIAIHPHAPTTADAITLRSAQYCSVGSHTVTRNGNEIDVVLSGGRCPTPPLTYAYEVPLGQLPAGQYRIEVPGPEGVESMTFVVRDVAPRVTIRPSVVPANTTGFRIELDATQDFSLCDTVSFVNCPATVIEIGGAVITGAQPGPGRATFDAPSLSAGWKDLRVTNGRGTFVFPAAVYYHSPGSEPDVYAFERILFPVLFSTGGANASSWRSEAVISNPTRHTIENANELLSIVCVQYPCGERLAPRSRVSFEGEGYPHGIALLVPRAEADSLAFRLSIRDVSRNADNLGTEIPVVRESEMLREPASGPTTGGRGSGLVGENSDAALLDVPRDPRYRTKVRVYGFRVDPIEVDGRDPLMRLVSTAGVVLQEIPLELKSNCTGPPCAATPAYAEIDLAAGAQDERVDVYVQFPEGYLGWAFASVTNNATQQVTIVSSNGKGGRPCNDDC